MIYYNKTLDEREALNKRSAEIMDKILKGRKLPKYKKPDNTTFSQEQDKLIESDFKHYNS